MGLIPLSPLYGRRRSAGWAVAWRQGGVASLPGRSITSFLVAILALVTAEGIADPGAESSHTFQIAKLGNAILVPVEIESRTYDFLLDTGAGVTLFDISLTGLLGGPTRWFPVYSTLDNDPKHLQLYRAPKLALGRRALRHVSDVLCMNLDEHNFRFDGRTPDGVLGMDALRGLILKIDFDRGELSLLRSLPESPGRVVPLSFQRGVPCVRVGVPGHGTTYFAVDTGAIGLESGNIESSLLRSLIEARAAAAAGESSRGTIFGEKLVRKGRLADFSLAGFEHHRLLFNEGSINTLSLGYLSRYVVIFDFQRMQMYLTPGARHAEPDRRDLSGLHPRRTEDAMVVDWLDEAGAAQAAGLREGDVLLELDGVAGARLTEVDLLRMLATPSTRWVTIRRGEATLRVKLEVVSERRQRTRKRE